MEKKNIIMVVIALLMLSSLNWEWTNIKSFISGGVLAVWLMQTFCNE